MKKQHVVYLVALMLAAAVLVARMYSSPVAESDKRSTPMASSATDSPSHEERNEATGYPSSSRPELLPPASPLADLEGERVERVGDSDDLPESYRRVLRDLGLEDAPLSEDYLRSRDFSRAMIRDYLRGEISKETALEELQKSRKEYREESMQEFREQGASARPQLQMNHTNGERR